MSKNSNTIEINGKRYNAATGALLTPAVPNSTDRPEPASQPPARAPKPIKHEIIRPPARQSASRTPAPSRTLMRRAVKKPVSGPKRYHKAQGHTDDLALQSLSKVIVKPSALRLDEQRLRHARQIPHSHLISRFPALTSDSFGNDRQPSLADESAASAGTDTAQAAQPLQSPHAVSSGPASKGPKTTSELLERAIEQSTSHLETLEKPKKSNHEHLKRNTGIGAAMGLSVIILGVIVTQNLANVRLQTASAKAGFNVSLPNYRPAGYSLGQLNYNQGVADVQFRSNSDERHYTITQKRSPWDSAALLNNFVALSYPQYQTVSSHGLTIYLYSNQSATWVKGGVWYVIQSDGSLNNRQLVDLATSL